VTKKLEGLFDSMSFGSCNLKTIRKHMSSRKLSKLCDRLSERFPVYEIKIRLGCGDPDCSKHDMWIEWRLKSHITPTYPETPVISTPWDCNRWCRGCGDSFEFGNQLHDHLRAYPEHQV
jgi:hypothetical protein